MLGAELPQPRQEVVAAIADGIGGAKGGRTAAESAVRGYLDGFCDLPETMEVQRVGARIVTALNGWINSIGRQDPRLAGLGCTLTALVLRGRSAPDVTARALVDAALGSGGADNPSPQP